ncbi:MAG: hypothetical protein WBO28_09860 [Flavobacteriales bacterium]
MSDQDLDPRMETFISDAQGREDVYHFKQLLGEVAAKVEASEADTPVIPIGRKVNYAWIAAAASVALLIVTSVFWFDRPPNHTELAMAYAKDERSMLRGDDAPNTDADEVLLDSARVQLSNGQAKEALSLIEDRSFAAPCTEANRLWLVALAHLMLDQSDQAKSELQTVAGSGCMVKDAAKELLEKL